MNLLTGLGGNFQRVNAALAIALSHNWLMRKNNNVSHNSFITQQYWNPELRLYQYPVFELTKPYLQGLTDVRWPGRAQILRLKVHNGDEKNQKNISKEKNQN
jgi:folylpolyglutamate synthase/dihydropteroate synthase